MNAPCAIVSYPASSRSSFADMGFVDVAEDWSYQGSCSFDPYLSVPKRERLFASVIIHAYLMGVSSGSTSMCSLSWGKPRSDETRSGGENCTRYFASSSDRSLRITLVLAMGQRYRIERTSGNGSRSLAGAAIEARTNQVDVLLLRL